MYIYLKSYSFDFCFVLFWEYYSFEYLSSKHMCVTIDITNK